MFKHIRQTALVLSLVACCPMAARADANDSTARGRMGDAQGQTRLHKMIDDSMTAYRAVVKSSQGEVPSNVLKNARCIAVLPGVISGAVGVGGAHGDGLASCKDRNNAWSQPAAISLNEGSIGLQAGVKSTDLVLFFENPESVAALKRGKFAFGTDVSAVVGKYDAAFDSGSSGVVIYSNSGGLFAGAALTGSVVGKDKDEMTSYYGKSTTYTGLLEGSESPDTSGYTRQLTLLFPQ